MFYKGIFWKSCWDKDLGCSAPEITLVKRLDRLFYNQQMSTLDDETSNCIEEKFKNSQDRFLLIFLLESTYISECGMLSSWWKLKIWFPAGLGLGSADEDWTCYVTSGLSLTIIRSTWRTSSLLRRAWLSHSLVNQLLLAFICIGRWTFLDLISLEFVYRKPFNCDF